MRDSCRTNVKDSISCSIFICCCVVKKSVTGKKIFWYPGPRTVLRIELGILKGAGHCVPLRPVCAPWGDVSFPKCGAFHRQPGKEGGRTEVQDPTCGDARVAGKLLCEKGSSLCFRSNGRFFLSGKYLKGLLNLKSLKAMGVEGKTEVKDTSLQEKSRHQGKLFSKRHLFCFKP